MIVHPPAGTAVADRCPAALGYVGAADLLDVRLTSDRTVRTSVVRWVDSTQRAPSLDFVLDQAGERLVGLVVEDASQWVPAAVLDGSASTAAGCVVTASGRLWVSLLPEAPEVWRTATRVAPRGGSPAVQLLWSDARRLVALEVEDLEHLHPSVLRPRLQAAPG